MQCSEIMWRTPEHVSPDATVAEAARRMRDACMGFLPVCAADGTVLGVITDRDIVLRVEAGGLVGEVTAVAAVMTTDVIACRPGDSVESAVELMGRLQKSRLVVLDDEAHLAGVISLSDLAQHGEPLRVARLLRDVYAREYRVRGSRA